ncbi:polysaccharide biosynthesis protein [Microbacterium sp. 3J1]|uniref:polysaccharide biosynthesis protein n=1 Tax=Microbacterium sp. 3J1 TaxID=861269 RepID=UPI0011478389|nr:polysaccharide biosynthesis protein [Microbacterium sp. 3J1]
MRSLMLRLAGFTGAPVLSALAPFIILPVISRIVGDEGWANFSAGQSIGILGMVGVLFGWGILGPVRVARSDSRAERAVILHESLRSRLILAAVVMPLAGIVAAAVSGPAYRVETIAVAVAMTASGLTPAWFCIGQGDARGLMIFDALPKLAASLIALPLIAFWGAILAYPALLLALCLPAYAIHAWLNAHARLREERRTPAFRRIIRMLAPTAAIDATGNAYGSTSIPIATAGLDAADASAFASADRAYRIGTLLIVAVGNALQAWVLDRSAVDARARQRFALIAHGALGMLGGFAIALLGPWATALVFGPKVAADPLPCAFFGIAFFCISMATPLIRNLLIPANRARVVFMATITAAVVGLTIMLAGSFLGAAEVIAMGVAASEFAALVVLAGPALSTYRRGASEADGVTPAAVPPAM